MSKSCGCSDKSQNLMEEKAILLNNVPVADNIFCATFKAPRIAKNARPGQFVHMQIPNFDGHVLRRPFSIYMYDEEVGTLDIMYQVVGAGSEKLSQTQPGAETSLIGPIGHGWKSCFIASCEPKKAVLVAGGVGVAPITMLAKQFIGHGAEVTCIVGATTKAKLVGTEYLEQLGAKVLIATDDGTIGHHGFCTELIEDELKDAVYVGICGPAPMEKIAVALATEKAPQAICEVSLERLMACGIGACLSCVVDTTEGKKRACVDGPVFKASKVVW